MLTEVGRRSFKQRTWLQICPASMYPGNRDDEHFKITSLNMVFQGLAGQQPELLRALFDTKQSPCADTSLCFLGGACADVALPNGTTLCNCSTPCTTYWSQHDLMFHTATVKEWTSGYADETLSLIHNLDAKLAPATYPGLFANQTHEDAETAGWYTVHTGYPDSPDIMWDYTSFLGSNLASVCTNPAYPSTCSNPWATTYAGTVGGSDGLNFPRGLASTGDDLKLWAGPFYRALPLENVGGETVNYKGIEMRVRDRTNDSRRPPSNVC